MRKLLLIIVLISLGLAATAQTAEEYYFRGNSKDDLEDYYGAIADYTKSIEINPHYRAYFNRGISKYNLGDKNGACQDARKAQDLGSASSKFIAAVCK